MIPKCIVRHPTKQLWLLPQIKGHVFLLQVQSWRHLESSWVWVLIVQSESCSTGWVMMSQSHGTICSVFYVSGDPCWERLQHPTSHDHQHQRAVRRLLWTESLTTAEVHTLFLNEPLAEPVQLFSTVLQKLHDISNKAKIMSSRLCKSFHPSAPQCGQMDLRIMLERAQKRRRCAGCKGKQHRCSTENTGNFLQFF